ncbi:MAG TPA: YceI family protein [Puia sp.]|nr:YceI family protein [Puia sp.]
MTKTKWVLDPTHSKLGFKIRHLMISHVSGSFKRFDVQLETEGNDFGKSKIKLKADIDSIDTNHVQRDAHLVSGDFFQIDKHPVILFESTRVRDLGDENLFVQGNLTMKGVTLPVKLQVTFEGVGKDPWGSERAGFHVTAKINRTDWGINFNAALETGGVMLGEEVKIEGELELVKQEVPVPA